MAREHPAGPTADRARPARRGRRATSRPPCGIGPIGRLAECLRRGSRQAGAAGGRRRRPARTSSTSSTCCCAPSRRRSGGLGGAVWNATAYGSAKGARDAAKGLVDRRSRAARWSPVLDPLVEPILARLGAELARFTLQQAEERSHSGRLTFHDLLVLCRRLVHHPEPRRAGPPVAGPQRTSRSCSTSTRTPTPFSSTSWSPSPRPRASPTAPRAAVLRRRPQAVALPVPSRRHRPVPADARPRRRGDVSLTTNFRSTPPIIDWVNHVFDRLIESTTDGRRPVLAQPDFEALDARPAPALHGPPVTVLGSEPHPAGDPRQRAAGGRGRGRGGHIDRIRPKVGRCGRPAAARRGRPG